ncbi:hypothetical protein [Filomicrobium sp.]|uniref:hypothetical protein n=1 Tax=Filomicrobium sp. TaxID=2024831 RepID=UPI00258B8A53|nr:hypothetical protein [Filomicrobium sp.]MCV0371714.1 hypothetical protein [Filomicrobium sp.]
MAALSFEHLIPGRKKVPEATAQPEAPKAGGPLTFDHLVPKSSPAPQAPMMQGGAMIPANAPRRDVSARPRSEMGWGEWAADLVTGGSSTEFPDASEFLQAYAKAGGSQDIQGMRAIMGSGITPDENAQLDILRKSIPGLQVMRDTGGNLMLKTPEMTEFAYLNKPGASWRDLDEIGTQTLATMPFGGALGMGASKVAQAGIGAGAMGGASLVQDVLAQQQGSDQGFDWIRAGFSAGLGTIFGPLSAWLGGKARNVAPDTEPATVPRGTQGPEPQPQPAPQSVPGDGTVPVPQSGSGVPPSQPATTPQAPSTTSSSSKIVTPDQSMEVDAIPQVVELDQLQLAGGKFQPRDRTRAEYLQEARERANRLDPAQLQPGRVSDSGAPIVLEDGTIISGNGRALSIAEVYENPALKAQADAYRASLPPEAQNMKRPVLVMRAPGLQGDEAARFADLSNRGRVASMSATERAARDAATLHPDDLMLYRGGDFSSPDNMEFTRLFMTKAVTPGERSALSVNGQLTKEAADRMRGAVLASAYDDPGTLTRLLESTDDNIRGLSGAMVDAAPSIARLKADAAAGAVMPHLEPSAVISDAVKFIADLRNRGMTPAQYFAQADAFDRLDPAVTAWVRAIYNDDLSGQISRPQLASLIRNYADEASKHAPDGLFADPTTSLDVLNVAKRAVGQQATPNTAPGAAPAPGPQAVQSTPPGGPGVAPQGQPVALPPEFRGQRNTPHQGNIPSYMREVPPQIEAPTNNQVVEAGQRAGVPIPRAIATDNQVKKYAAGKMAEIPIFGHKLRSAVRGTEETLSKRARAIADSLSGDSKFSVGDAVNESVRNWIDDGSADLLSELYKSVGKQFSKKTTSSLATTRKIANDLTREMAESTSRVNQKALDLVEEAIGKPGGLTYDGLVRLRQDIGARLSGSIIPEPGTPMPALKRLYGALAEDLHGLVFTSGGKPALSKYMQAERVSQLVAQRREMLQRLVGTKDNPASAEQIVERILGMATDAGRANIQQLLRLRKSLNRFDDGDTFQGIAAAAIRKLGQSSDGTFSPAVFLRDYQKLSPNGKLALFGSDVKSQLDDLATISTKFKELQRYGNPSGTGGVVALFSMLGTGGIMGMVTGGPVIPGLTAGVGYVMSHMLARPAMVKQAGRWVKAFDKALHDPSGRGQVQLTIATKALANALAEEFDADPAELEREMQAATREMGI